MQRVHDIFTIMLSLRDIIKTMYSYTIIDFIMEVSNAKVSY